MKSKSKCSCQERVGGQTGYGIYAIIDKDKELNHPNDGGSLFTILRTELRFVRSSAASSPSPRMKYRRKKLSEVRIYPVELQSQAQKVVLGNTSKAGLPSQGQLEFSKIRPYILSSKITPEEESELPQEHRF